MAKLTAYLTFNGNCKEAMEFYKSCLGGELQLMTVGESPAAARMPAAMRDKIMHSSLKAATLELLASDMFDQAEYRHGNTVTLTLICESKAEIEKLFANLSKGGRVRNPLSEEFFGTYANLTDKYGFTWMLQFGINNSPK